MSTRQPSTAERLHVQLSEALDGRAFCERRFHLAGKTVRLQATSDELLRHLYGAFEHLAVASSAPDLEIRIGEGAVWTPPPDHALSDGQSVGGHRYWTSPDRRYFSHTIVTSGSWYCVDRVRGRIAGWVRSTNGMSTFERAKPVVRPLLLWLEQCGLTPVHTGLVSWRGSGIMLGGRGGSGKTTAALASLEAGLDMLAEDYTLIRETGAGDFEGHSLYSSAWVEADHLWRFPGLAGGAVAGDEMAGGKCIMMLHDGHAGRLAAVAPVHYLVLPRVRANGRTALHPATRADGLKRFALETMVTLTRLGTAELQRLTRLVRTVDCYWLDLGADLDQVGVLLKALVERRAR